MKKTTMAAITAALLSVQSSAPRAASPKTRLQATGCTSLTMQHQYCTLKQTKQEFSQNSQHQRVTN